MENCFVPVVTMEIYEHILVEILKAHRTVLHACYEACLQVVRQSQPSREPFFVGALQLVVHIQFRAFEQGCILQPSSSHPKLTRKHSVDMTLRPADRPRQSC